MLSAHSQQVSEKSRRIRELLKPILERFQQQCVNMMKEDIGQCISELEASEMDLYAITPISKRQFIRKFVTPGIIIGSKCKVEVDKARVQKVEQYAKFQASSDFDRYAEKIEQKICNKFPNGEVISLSLDGDLWKQSILTVATATGESVQFVTKTIINRSRYGNRFFQFPTRCRTNLS